LLSSLPPPSSDNHRLVSLTSSCHHKSDSLLQNEHLLNLPLTQPHGFQILDSF